MITIIVFINFVVLGCTIALMLRYIDRQDKINARLIIALSKVISTYTTITASPLSKEPKEFKKVYFKTK